jgi:phage FluMu gp28-like protein
VYTPGALVVVVSPSQRQSAEMLRTIKGLLAKLDGAPDSSDSVLKIELANGSRILALPGTEKTIRGLAGAALVIIDEAARVEDELLAAVRPMLATNANGRLIALTTPAGKRGFFYEAWHGAPEAWHRVKVGAEDCPRISKAFLAEELRELGPTRYSEEYGLQFVDSLTSAFPTTIIDRAFTSEIRPLWI